MIQWGSCIQVKKMIVSPRANVMDVERELIYLNIFVLRHVFFRSVSKPILPNTHNGYNELTDVV